jgi:DNA-binding Xre family transcriptional regulator
MATAATETPAAMLGLRIMTLLHQQQMSVYMLAKRADVPLRTVQRIVAGEGKQPSVWTIAAMARVLGVSMDDLVALPDREDTPAAKPPATRPRTRKAASAS